MGETSFSMLERLQQGPDATAWQHMLELYSPLIRNWLKRYSLPDQDVDDLVQDVLTVVVRKLPEFHKRPQIGAFRRWLRTITAYCLRDFWRSQRFVPKTAGDGDFGGVLDQLEDPESALSKLWDQEHDEHIARRLLEMIRPRFEEKTWQAFRRVALEGAPVDQVAQELHMTANAVFIAKSRVLRLLRMEGQDILS